MTAHFVRTTSEDDRRAEIIAWMRKIAEESEFSYGSRRMKKAGIQVRYKKKYKVTTNSNHKQPVFDNVLNRQFDVATSDTAYVQDITYIWTREG